ncbi:TRAP transporter large permease [Metapseudomonas otitidis]|jgi:tripartite ATP-independent transporter DctM subunit|uniref:TRAP transporter large permease protein n=2 Tax=Metapseudomonas otitidis TaxID=319939 RepID=A0A1I0TCV0_9GAMM|nr:MULTISPECIES: TRAP transporter large permease [Pseudomonas]KIV72206.1 TRAP dicarboxylate transporter, DctM subunit, unknown substrate 3 [Pseudomonas sp. FeS53a]MBO2930477.1 TRAP transporter large permease [Pseudomonas otitidis]MCP1617725.1 tripartite ATP-independent transporter DctM subunit [Pseudomonas otitidis]MDG9782962.1 TRAP transporter large permease [Pseudomonas otitidis]MDH0339554.1 TRAP transporter large permease [Pseudomonas otitidis]
MSGLALGLIALAITMSLLLLRVHIGITMLVGGAACFWAVNDGDLSSLLFTLNDLAYSRLSNYDLAVIPLFVLMGQFATHGGLSRAIFRCASAFIGHWKGGMGLSAIGACAGFGAICGSSLATAATMSHVALPELRRHNYSGRLATATVAAGGTLGILIPPSVPLIIYAVLTQESIAKLFVAAIVPGVIAILGYMLVLRIMVARDESQATVSPRASTAERLRALLGVSPVIGVFLVVIVGIYGGWANPTEAASIGAAACGVLAVLQGGMRWSGLRASLLGTAETTAMIFLVLLGADLLNSGLALTQMPGELAAWVIGSGLAPMLVLILILALYLLLGCVMDSLAMILLTIPIFYPMIMGLDFFGLGETEKSIWFGILALMVVEIGLIHPPLGMNLFIVQRAAGDVPYGETARGIVPFLCSDLVRIALLVAFPGLSLWLLSL